MGVCGWELGDGNGVLKVGGGVLGAKAERFVRARMRFGGWRWRHRIFKFKRGKLESD